MGCVKREGMRREESGMLEMWGKNGICVETRTYVGTSFVRRQGGYEVEICDIKLL